MYVLLEYLNNHYSILYTSYVLPLVPRGADKKVSLCVLTECSIRVFCIVKVISDTNKF